MSTDVGSQPGNHRRLRILYVAYPLVAVSAESCGGAEQMLWLLEREMHDRGHRTTVACCPNSQISGELVLTSEGARGADQFEACNAEHVANVCRLVAQRRDGGLPFDLIHDESGGFWRHAADVDTPVLATLHLPRSFYPAESWRRTPANVCFNCVSLSQATTFNGLPGPVATIANGIDLDRYEFQESKSDYVLWLGRLCEEKGAHIALDIAEQANAKLVLAGSVYPFSYHLEYCDREIVPRMQRGNGRVIFVDLPALRKKIELLQNAKAVLIPSLAEETSSLTAMEAMACGTPVIALRRGALPEIVADGITGVIANSEQEMLEALRYIGKIRPTDCRRRAENCFDGLRMCDEYEALYEAVSMQKSKHAA